MNKNNFVIGIQVRSNSTRLPGKCLMDLCGIPLWYLVFLRSKDSGIETVMLPEPADQPIIDSLHERFVPFLECVRKDPLSRYFSLYIHAKLNKIKNIIRITADCPLVQPWIIVDMAYQFERDKISFMYNELDGMDVQIADLSIFDYPGYLDEEHVFNMDKIKEHGLYTKWEMHLSVDTKEQFDHIKFLMEE